MENNFLLLSLFQDLLGLWLGDAFDEKAGAGAVQRSGIDDLFCDGRYNASLLLYI